MVPSSIGVDWPTARARRRRDRRARPRSSTPASKVAILAGQGARGARAELERGRRTARRRRGQGAAGQGRAVRRPALRHRLDRPARHPAQLRDDDATATRCSPSGPASRTPSSCPSSARRARSRSTSTPSTIGMRYPYEVNLVGDAAATLRALIPLLERKEDRSWREDDRGEGRALVGGHGAPRPWSRPTRSTRCGCSPSCPPRLPDERDRHRRLRLRGQLVRPPAALPRRDARLAVREPGHHGPRRPLRYRRQVRPPGPAGRSSSPATAPCR